MVAKIQFQVDMSIKALFPNDQREVENILREKNHNMKKQLKQRRKKEWRSSLTGQTMAITCEMKT